MSSPIKANKSPNVSGKKPTRSPNPLRQGYSAKSIKNLINQVQKRQNEELAKRAGERVNKAVNKALRSGYSATSIKNLINKFEKKVNGSK